MNRHKLLAIAFLVAGGTSLQAQERVPLPPPDPPKAIGPGAPLLDPPALPPPSTSPIVPKPLPYAQPSPPAPYSTPGGYGPYGPPPGPYGPYGPPPGAYGPPPRRAILGDPVADPNYWFGIEGLLWWSKSQPLSPPVITTGPASQGSNAGGLGMPGTTSLNGPLGYGAEGGMRIYAGCWFNPSHTIGLDGSLFFLGQQNSGFGASDRSGTGNFVINEPLNGAPPFVTQVSAPGLESGAVQVNAYSRFWGADLNARVNIFRESGMSLSLVGGFRYLQLDEGLTIAANSNLFVNTTYTDNMNNVLATAPPGSSVLVVDQFGTRNQFYGGQLGAQFQFVSDRWYFGATGKIALGATHETVNINGSTTVFPVNGTPVPLSGGNYATIQSGSYSTNRFAVAPEVQLNVGYQFTPFMRGMIGYNFIYLSSVARPGNQIDNNYDGVTHPIVPMASSSFWAQGINFSLQFSY